jgi:hypothetical protein
MNNLGFGYQIYLLSYSILPAMQEFYKNNFAGFMGSPSDAAGGTLSNTPFLPGMSAPEVIDPSSIVPGIGLGAFDFPQPPGVQVYMDLNSIKTQHLKEQRQFAYDIHRDSEAKKAAVFSENHYQFDAAGNPVVDENGKPKLFEGPETSDLKKLRENWEKQVMKDTENKLKEELAQLSEKSSSLIKEAYSDISNALDPEKNRLLREQLMEIARQETELRQKQENELRKAIAGHLPDLDNPGSTIGSFIDDRTAQYKALIEGHQAIENSSEPAQLINNYVRETQAFVQRQNEKLEEYKKNFTFNPDAMKDFMKSIGYRNF